MTRNAATTHNSQPLTSVEVSSLWNGYLVESLVHHMFKYFLQNIDDPDIKELVETCHTLSKKQMDQYRSIFHKDNFPIPNGIQIEDINVNAPRLFSDIYYINYIKNMAKFALLMHVNAFTEVTRDDVTTLFSGFIDNLKDIEIKATDLMLSKGLYTRPPLVPIPESIDVVESKKFLGSFFESNRPLTVHEISQLFTIAEGNALGKATSMAFSQVSQDKQIQEYILKGKDIAHRYIQLFNDVLLNEDIPTVKTYDSEVTEITVSPFSDRLLMFHVSLLAKAGIGNYGMAIAKTQRKDIGLMYARILAEATEYATEGAKLMIKKGWMEQPPLAANRDKLVEKD
ncbi:DUF3231 family protein [Bacillus shivajii]|uniref:DUF3231 family protein n=1 Tax=Bacillus shivajii TaxID=1983719 RepID=UPI001CF9ABE8|nr:DUF3231 family protein [Bacillus shivajii]UCZ55109.1 DUF3231 family protein [Bacillus shivajii]